MSDITDRVKKIVVEHLNVDESKVSDEASFIDDLGADSLDTVELVMAFEEEFDIEIPDDAAETIQTFGDAVKFINDKLSLNIFFMKKIILYQILHSFIAIFFSLSVEE